MSLEELESILEDLTKPKQTFMVLKRSLPIPGINKIIAGNFPTYDDALKFIKITKLKTIEKFDSDNAGSVIYYDILPEIKEYKDVFYNDPKFTTCDTNKKSAAKRYFDIED